jgi:hypothetical protein
MPELYRGRHHCQYDGSGLTPCCGCTWTSGASGADASTGGERQPLPDHIHAQVARNEENNPSTPGWHLDDLALALRRLGIGFDNHTGEGWGEVVAQLESDHYVVLQGDSDQFANSTCSGEFDGTHAVGVHPRKKWEGGERWRWIDDPICKTPRWERESVLKRYAQKLYDRVFFGAFRQQVPLEADPPPAPQRPTLRYGGRALANPHRKRLRERAPVRRRPDPEARRVATKRAGERFNAWQVSYRNGHRWYGNFTGRRWIRADHF